MVAAFAASIVAHLIVGALKTLITAQSWRPSGLKMTIAGILEAAVTYNLGLVFGAA